ncbi:MAG: DUF4091 domain-containing protein [Clostridia bacterium]|nr:DUF4091 domain-containing protein [Clostridia bacterium]
MLLTKFVSNLEKCFLDENIADKYEVTKDSILLNERYTVQLAIQETDTSYWMNLYMEIQSPLKEYITLYKVESVPVRYPMYAYWEPDNLTNFIRLTPGLYPDILRPYADCGMFNVAARELNALWIDVQPKGKVPAGTYPITVLIKNGQNEVITENTFTLEILDASLPPQKMLYTEWFHTDCLAVYYDTPVFSEKYWEIVENFMKNAAEAGINLILTPTFTPPLDTKVGGERPTVQLVDVTVEIGQYSFDFTRVGRWVETAHRCGIENFEIAHFFTQWGAKHAPKVMATADGEYKRIFGWDTDATSDEYARFLRQFVQEFLVYMKSIGCDKNCYFHISDEPSGDKIESYMAAKSIVQDLLEGYTIMDALSHYEFYESGALDTPIPANNAIEPFLEHNVPNLWTYYCCAQHNKVSNRFMSMPSARNRIIGYQFYKYDIVGFLQWGYNFYFNQYSVYPIDPYLITDADYFVPAGDAFSVYPGPGGKPLDSLRARVFYDALQDYRLLELAESLAGREAVMDILEGDLPEEEKITFSNFPTTISYMHESRAAVHNLIRKHI